eukprot:COSAG04_NODE_2441_length_4118_cov_3.509579_4_plen_62_part_00
MRVQTEREARGEWSGAHAVPLEGPQAVVGVDHSRHYQSHQHRHPALTAAETAQEFSSSLVP